MSNLNKLCIIGRLGRDPETKALQSGKSVTRFSVAVEEKWNMANGETNNRTEWFDVDAWGKTGEACAKYLAKGSLVYVEGRFESREYEKDGQKRKAYTLVAYDVKFLSKKPEAKPETARDPFADDSDLPF